MYTGGWAVAMCWCESWTVTLSPGPSPHRAHFVLQVLLP